MPFNDIDPSRYKVDAPTSQDLFQDIVDNLNYLKGVNTSAQTVGGSALVINGSFEADPLDTLQPQGWNFDVDGTDSVGRVTDTDQNHGAQAYQVTQPTGQAGGRLVTCDDNDPDNEPNFYVSPNFSYLLSWELKCSAASVHNIVEVRWFDESKASVSGWVTVLDIPSGSSPVDWRAYARVVTPASTARFGSLRFTLGAGDALSTSQREIYVDNVSFAIRPSLNRVVFTTAGAGSWNVPAGVFSARVHLVGAGGGGLEDSSPTGPQVGSGGGGGGYVSGRIPVYPDQNVSFSIGAGGTPGISGGNTTCTTLLGTWTANGGAGATNHAVGGAGGSFSASGADVLIAGQTGKLGYSNPIISQLSGSSVDLGQGGANEFSLVQGVGGRGGKNSNVPALSGTNGMVVFEY